MVQAFFVYLEWIPISIRHHARILRDKKEGKDLAGCSKRPFSKAAGESKPEAYPLGYVEDFDELRTKLAGFSDILQLLDACLAL